MRLSLWVLVIFVLCNSMMAQADGERYTMADIQDETTFLEASSLQVTNNFEEAIEKYKSLIKRHRYNAVIPFQLSRCYEATEQYDLAIKYGKLAVKLDATNEFYHMQLAESYEANKAYSNCAEAYLAYTRIQPKNAFFYERAVFFYLQDGQVDRALEIMNQMEQNIGFDEKITRQKFEIYTKLDRPKDAAIALESLVTAFPSVLRYRQNLANYYVQIGDVKSARKVYKDILQQFPSNEEAKLFLKQKNSKTLSDPLTGVLNEIALKQISIDSKIGKIVPWLTKYMEAPNAVDKDKLLQIGSSLVEHYPNEAKAYALQGDIYLHTGFPEKAISAYQSTIERNAAIFEVWYQLMTAQKSLGLFTELAESSNQALLRFPNQVINYVFHAHALNRTEQYSDAWDIAEEALEMGANQEALKKALHAEMARSAYFQKDQERLTKHLRAGGESEGILELKGDIAKDKGNMQEAMSYWKQALQLNPNNKAVQNKVKSNE